LALDVQHAIGVGASDGDWVLTSGVGGSYPRGLVIGEIATVTHRDTSTSDLAEVAWVNEPTSVSFVLVITDFIPSWVGFPFAARCGRWRSCRWPGRRGCRSPARFRTSC